MDQGPFPQEVDNFFNDTFVPRWSSQETQTQPRGDKGRSMSTADTDLTDPYLTDLSLDFEFDVANEQVSTNLSSIPEPSRVMPIPQPSTPLSNPSVELTIEVESKSNSQCILVCCSIITVLENFIDAQVKILELALDMVRKAVSSLGQVIERRPRSQRSRTLLLIVMD